MSIPRPASTQPDSSQENPVEDEDLEQSQHNDVQVDDLTKVENNNVIDPNQENSSGPAGPQPTEPASQPSLLTMPGTLALPDLTLHSPSSQIIGTPFATNSTRFEYPFPESSVPTDSHQTTLSISPSFPSLSSSSILSGPLSSSSPPQSLSTTPPSSLTHFPTAFPPPISLTNYSPSHPKLRTGNPPVPPGLAKKRGRWSLGLLRRRSTTSSYGSQSSDGSPRSPGSVLSSGSLIDIGGDHATSDARDSKLRWNGSADLRPQQQILPEDQTDPPRPPPI